MNEQSESNGVHLIGDNLLKNKTGNMDMEDQQDESSNEGNDSPMIGDEMIQSETRDSITNMEDQEDQSSNEQNGSPMVEDGLAKVTDNNDMGGEEDRSSNTQNGSRIVEDGQTKTARSLDADDQEEPIPKKPCLEINIRKLLPDLEKHWKTVEEDPSDFTAWTYLLQYVDQENELLAAREAYDTFLSRYPYCYGYWKKYADYEKRRGSASDCEQVFRRGLKAVSLSVDLWIHYLNYVKATHEKQPEYIRAQFEAALEACGMEFRSDKLWEHYVHWEKENKEMRKVLAIYDKVISTPTQSHAIHFQNVKDLINQSSPSEILSEEELEAVVEQEGLQNYQEDSEIEARLKEILVEKRNAAYKQNEIEIAARWTFEEAIKRPYFHVKPLEKGQLKIWKEYLDFEIEKGIYKRSIVLFERCLIACALYEEYWIKYAKFLQVQPDVDTVKLRDVFTRASTIHHQKKPWINLHWASFEESQGNYKQVETILDALEKQFPDSLHIQFRRINYERRVGALSKCIELFEKYIQNSKSKNTTSHLTIKYARFLSDIMNDYEGAKKLLLDVADWEEIARCKAIMALVDITMQKKPVDADLVLATFDDALIQGLSNEQKITFAHRKLEFLEDYSPDIIRIEKAQAELQSISKQLREQKPADEAARTGEEATKGNNTGAYPDSSQQGSFGQNYNNYGQQQGQYSNWNSSQTAGYSNNSQGYYGYYG